MYNRKLKNKPKRKIFPVELREGSSIAFCCPNAERRLYKALVVDRLVLTPYGIGLSFTLVWNLDPFSIRHCAT
jgi:hypothetical protein